MATKLRAVGPEDVPPPDPKTITEAAREGATLSELQLIRVRIAKALDDPNCPFRDIASLSRRLIEIAKEIDSLKARAAQEDDPVAKVEDGDFDEAAI